MKTATVVVATIAGLLLLVVPAVRANDRDPAGYERLLIPLLTNQDLPGALGSLWRTELVIRNAADIPVQVFQSSCAFFCDCEFVTECPLEPLAPHSLNEHAAFVEDDIRNDGAYLYVQRRYLDSIAFNLRLRDVSRNAQSAGTEVPIVRENRFLTGTARLMNVPLDSFSRVRLRLYGVTSPSGLGDLRVRIYALNGDVVLGEKTLSIKPWRFSTGGKLPPPDLQQDPQPGFNEIPSIRDLVPDITIPARLRIEVEPLTPGLVYWTLITVTNNETQEVTLVSPQ